MNLPRFGGAFFGSSDTEAMQSITILQRQTSCRDLVMPRPLTRETEHQLAVGRPKLEHIQLGPTIKTELTIDHSQWLEGDPI